MAPRHNAWPPRAVPTPIAGSIPSTCSRTSGAATIGLDFAPSFLLSKQINARLREPDEGSALVQRPAQGLANRG